MTVSHHQRAAELAEALLDRVKSKTALLPGALEKWMNLIQEQFEQVEAQEASRWRETVIQSREARDKADAALHRSQEGRKE